MKHVNAVVIGAGAGGGVVAKELAVAGLSVVLLERGKWYTPFDCRKDDLRNQRITELGAAFGPDEERNPRVFVDPRGQERVLRPSQGAYCTNGACVGGGTLSYGGMAWRFMEKDFRMRSTYGTLEGSTLDDWPISYDDLEPFYDKAEWEIGVAGDALADPFCGPRRRPLPMPPLPPNKQFEVLAPAARRLGLHPFPTPLLRNTVPRDGRPSCMRCRWCTGFVCEVNAKAGTHNTVIPTALASGNCELRTGCITKEILLDKRGRARGVAYYDANDRLQEQGADLVVVAGGAIESPRLLLNSKSALFPTGIGNRHDWVGRNLQGHYYTGAWGIFGTDVYDDLGPGCSVAVCDFNHGNPGLNGGAMLHNEVIWLPYQYSRLRPPGVPQWGKAHKEFMRRTFKRATLVFGPTQEMPMFDCRVQVDPKVKDDWGIPVARLSGQSHPHTCEIATAMASKAEMWLKEAGAETIWLHGAPARPGLSAGGHQAGTCRMGNDPKTSVVNRYCQVHDVDNLFVTDASVHVTNGGFNPVLTIMAVAYHASDYIVRNWRGAGLK